MYLSYSGAISPHNLHPEGNKCIYLIQGQAMISPDNRHHEGNKCIYLFQGKTTISPQVSP